MTDNEIIKVLEIHADYETGCSECPIYHSDTGDTCAYELAQNALDLIKRQKVKIKEFDENIVIQKGLIDLQKAEIEKLNKENENLLIKLCKKVNQESKAIKKLIKAEAIKEFAERLQDRCAKQDGCLWSSDIGAELNEFLGDKNE